jgi:N-acyl homoserine lactone hydrolase
VEIQALSTGTVQVKTKMARGHGTLAGRLARTLLDRRYSSDLPIHVWLISHPDGPILVDAGERADARDLPLARFQVGPEQEVDRLLAGLELEPGDLQAVVVTHLHGDHAHGLACLAGVEVLASADALRFGARRLRAMGVVPSALAMSGRPLGAFADSSPVTRDGSVVVVPTPGHAPGHVSVLVALEDRHVLIAGDAAYSEAQLLEGHLDGVSQSGRRARDSMLRIRKHAARQATVFLPSHGPGSAARLAAMQPVAI